MAQPYLPLADLRVLDFGRLLPSALTAQKLQALGADVVKLEDINRPDWIRDLDPLWDGRSCQDQAVNGSKRSAAVDLREADGLALALALADAADVVLENWLPGQLQKLGVDIGAMRRARPELVACSITGYGQTGPFASMPSHGLNTEAMAGALPVEWNDGVPSRSYTFTSMAVETGAANAALAVVAAVAHVRAGGEGVWIDVACWDAAVEAHRVEIVMSGASGTPYKRGGRGAFYEIYRCCDDRLVLLGAIEQPFWARFCDGVGRPDLVGEWAGAGTLDFGEDRPHLKPVLAEIFATATAKEWIDRLASWKVPGSEVLEIADIMEHPQYRARGFVRDGGTFPVVAAPIRWHEHDEYAAAPAGLAPTCGQHTDEVVREWLER